MKKGLFLLLAAVCALVSCVEKEKITPTISVSRSEEYFESSGGVKSVSVTCNVDDWNFNVGNSWLKGVRKGSSLELTAEPNPEYERRTATVQLSAGSASTSFSVVQAALVFEPQLSIDVDRIVNVSDKASTLAVNVSTNLPGWTCETDAEWLSAECSGNVLNIAIQQNPLELSREAVVCIYAPAKEEYMIQTSFTIVQAEADIHYDMTDLSVNATSNCYVITHKGPYSFRADVCGNGKTITGMKAPAALKPVGAKLVWQTSLGVIQSVSIDGDRIVFEAGKKPGNALLAATDKSGNIIWSWHIWRPEVEITEMIGQDGSAFMNLNLGAITDDYSNIGCYGLLYQWGRKDPLPGSGIMSGGTTSTDNVPVYDLDGNVVKIGSTSMYNTRDNTLAFSIANPTTCISNNAQRANCRDWLTPSESNPSLWGNPKGSERKDSKYPNKGSKTFYDPCPPGWRVPHIQSFQHLTSLGSMVWAQGESDGVMEWYNLGGKAEFAGYDHNGDGLLNLLDFENGWWLVLNNLQGINSFFPATSRYDGNYAMLMGSMVGLWGNYWTNAVSLEDDGTDTYLGIALGFGIKEYGSPDYSVTVSPAAYGSRADGYSVRCIRE